MLMGYWIGRVDIADTGRYQAYIVANAEAFRKYGGRFLLRAGRYAAWSNRTHPQPPDAGGAGPAR